MAIDTSPYFLIIVGNRFEPFLASLGILGLTIVALFLLFQVLRSWFRQFKSDIPLVALSVSRIPLLAIVAAVGLNLALTTLPVTVAPTVLWLQRGLSALIVVLVTYWLAQLFTPVTSYALRQYAERTEAMWDDVLLPIVENTV